MTFPDTSFERSAVDPAVSHTDAPLSERAATGDSSEPSSVRVPRPSTSPAFAPYAPYSAFAPFAAPVTTWGDDRPGDDSTPRPRPSKLAFGLSVSWLTVLGTSVGVWLFLRWQHERNRPMNRLRRQAQQAAAVIRERVPTRLDDVSGLTSRVRSIR